MTPDLRFVAYSVALTWIMLMTASSMRTRLWTVRGGPLALGNRDDLPEPSKAAARADRAARNMLENLVLFASLVLVARAAGVDPARLELGASLFFWARVFYFPVYLVGIPYLRTAIWAVGVAGTAMIFAAMFW
jgi:uncharacterized MAPEG superfamily protein